VTACHICGFAPTEKLVQKGAPFKLVSSDVRPSDGAAEFSLCPRCHSVQKAVTPAWQAMAERIYAAYDLNHQSRGAEPMIFDSSRGSGPRSTILLRSFLDVVALPEFGRLLDIGCSNGNLLKSFHRHRPAWKLSGAELSDTFRETILSLPAVEAFYVGSNPVHAGYAGPYDVISLSHVLEHIPDPVSFLKAIADQLSADGRILLATPDLLQNPSDLIIADHCTHFDERSLRFVAESAGLAVELMSPRLLPKELIAILSRLRTGAPGGSNNDPANASKERCLFYFRLLDDVRREARSAASENRPFGVMGSSIAALWTMLELGRSVDFFVDEDPHRVGHSLAGVPIVNPAEVPAGGLVFIPMSVAVAEKIIGRWHHLPIEFRFVASNRPV
jgi:SAM-dependent methyltransferase